MRAGPGIVCRSLASALLMVSSLARAAGVPEPLERAVSMGDVSMFARVLDGIAKRNGGTRVAGSAGHEQSLRAFSLALMAAGYRVSTSEFEFSTWSEPVQPVLTQVAPSTIDFPANDPGGVYTAWFSANGDVTAPVQPVDVVIPPGPADTSTSGCEPEDFAGFTPGNIALLQRGGCDLTAKVANAQAAGASAVLLFNEGQPDRTDAIIMSLWTAGSPVSEFSIPLVVTSYAAGARMVELTQGGAEVRVHVKVDGLIEPHQTKNLFAETVGGDPDNVIMAGAHLDSIDTGPGLNDNGSGAAALLEIAIKLSRTHPVNKVRFAFWSAEEEGLVGSTDYVSKLSDDDARKIRMYLNLDMLASPNYQRLVLDGDGSDTGIAGPQGSGEIEKVFTDHFAARKLPVDPMALDGRGDYAPFTWIDIPVGGVVSSNDEVKTEEEARKFGGTAGQVPDPCYHLACDDYRNLNFSILEQLLRANAHAIDTFSHKPYGQAAGAQPAQPRFAVRSQGMRHRPGRHGHLFMR